MVVDKSTETQVLVYIDNITKMIYPKEEGRMHELVFYEDNKMIYGNFDH